MHHAETVGLVDQTPEMVEMASPGAMGDGGEKDVPMGGSSLAGRMRSIRSPPGKRKRHAKRRHHCVLLRRPGAAPVL